MKKSMIKRIIYGFIGLLMLTSLAGCAVVPELSLTEEQSELIAEYAAGLLVKYQIGHSMGITPLAASDLIEPAENGVADGDDSIDINIDVSNSEDDQSVAGEPSEGEDLSETDGGDDVVEIVSSTVPISEVFGVSGFDINYDRCEYATVYPQEENEDLIFSMQASPGNEFLIIHFNIINTSGASNACDLISADVKSRVIIDNGERIPAQATILDNDLLNFNSSVESDISSDCVLLFEVPEGTQDKTTSINLVLKGIQGENIYKIL